MGGGRGGLPDTKRGGGQSTSGPIYEKWGGGGAIRFRSITKSGGGSDVSSPIGVWEKLHKPGLAPHKRTLTLLGGGGGVRSNPPPLATGLMCVHACMQVCGYVYVCAAHVKNLYV